MTINDDARLAAAKAIGDFIDAHAGENPDEHDSLLKSWAASGMASSLAAVALAAASNVRSEPGHASLIVHADELADLLGLPADVRIVGMETRVGPTFLRVVVESDRFPVVDGRWSEPPIVSLAAVQVKRRGASS